jgi:hypothetical protein
MLKKLQDVGVKAELITVKGEGHGWGVLNMDDILENHMTRQT